MVRLAHRTPQPNGNYTELFGDERIGYLISQVQSAVIGLGNKLEKTLAERIPPEYHADLIDVFTGKYRTPHKDIVFKPRLPKSGELAGIVSDFAVFDHTRREVSVIELKLGYKFDTQKSRSIKSNLQTITDYISQHSHYTGRFYLCSWSAVTRLDVIIGTKRSFSQSQILLDRDLCAALEIDFKSIVSEREANRRYMLAMMDAIRRGVTHDEFFTMAEEYRSGQYKMRLD